MFNQNNLVMYAWLLVYQESGILCYSKMSFPTHMTLYVMWDVVEMICTIFKNK